MNNEEGSSAVFPQKLPYSEENLMLAIHAAVQLHNFIVNTENLSY